jgi:hypothetical protein
MCNPIDIFIPWRVIIRVKSYSEIILAFYQILASFVTVVHVDWGAGKMGSYFSVLLIKVKVLLVNLTGSCDTSTRSLYLKTLLDCCEFFA